MIAAIAAQQILALRRQRIFLAILATLLTMTALAGVIGWSSQQTIARVYSEAVKLLASTGQPAPPNPVTLKPTLSLISNMAVYITLIGALLAVVLGHLSVADDTGSGIGRLIFSRQVSRSSYVAGRLVGAGVVLAIVLLVSLLVSAASLVVVNGSAPSLGETARLVLFFALSWLYMMIFAVVGMVTVLLSPRRSLALLSALAVWLVVTFAVPQFTSGLRPVASLNPVTAPVSASQPFFRFTANGRAFSLDEQYKAAAGEILQTSPATSTLSVIGRTLPLAGALLILAGLTVWLVRRHDFSRSGADE